jgi:Spy/CpxP family protein refolding chaperone
VLIGSVALAALPVWSARAEFPAPPSPETPQFPAPQAPGMPQFPAPPAPGMPQFPAPAAPETQTPAPAEKPAKSEAGGIVQLVDRALQGIDLRPEQTEALQKLGAKVDEKLEPVTEARKNLVLALADEIEAGKVDKDTLKPEIEDVVKASETASPLLRKAFDKLHDILDAKQREEFVEHFKDELKEFKQKHPVREQLEKLAHTLALTDDQKAKIGEILEKDEGAGKKVHENMERVLDAFPSDSFSMDAVLPEGQVREHVEKMEGRIIEDAREVTDILTPEQRKIAAEKIRSRAAARRGGGKTGGESTGAAGSPLEATGSESEALWAARGFGGYGGFGYPGFGWGGGYGFSRGYAAGFGGGWMW